MIPNLKSGDPEEPMDSNTRPISLLPMMAKVCERAHSQFANFLHSYDKISCLQSGNRERHSTETTLLHYTDQLLNNMYQKKISFVVLLDMSKAFDSVRHDLLLLKMHWLGVSQSAHAWFECYLSSRSKAVKLGSVLSDPLPLMVEVARGSIPDPVLFTLYVNELLSVRKNCQTMGYVDVTKILLSLPPCNVSKAVDALNSDIEEVSRWCCANSLLINPDKTKLLVVGVPNLTRALSLPPIYLLGERLLMEGVLNLTRALSLPPIYLLGKGAAKRQCKEEYRLGRHRSHGAQAWSY